MICDMSFIRFAPETKFPLAGYNFGGSCPLLADSSRYRIPRRGREFGTLRALYRRYVGTSLQAGLSRAKKSSLAIAVEGMHLEAEVKEMLLSHPIQKYQKSGIYQKHLGLR